MIPIAFAKVIAVGTLLSKARNTARLEPDTGEVMPDEKVQRVIESLEWALLVVAGLVLLSVLLSPLAIRLGAPIILLIFLGIGMLVCQDGPGGFAFDDFALAYHMGGIALAVILFAGGLGTRVRDIRVCWGPALMLATLGVVITTAVVGVSIWLPGISVLMALLLGAVVGSTDAATSFLLLQGRGIRLKGRVMETIVAESGLNDPMAIFLTTVLVSFVDAGGAELSWALGGTFALQLGVGDAIWRARLEGRSDRVHVFCLRAGASAGHVRRAEAYPRLRWPEAVSTARAR